MTKLYLEKSAHKFSVAHMTVFPNGLKERLHGHNYSVSLGLEFQPLKFSEFVDFAVVKKIMRGLCDAWDERFLIPERCPYFKWVMKDGPEVEFKLCDKRYVIPSDEVLALPLENITVESLAELFSENLKREFKTHSLLAKLRSFEVGVTETEGQSGFCKVELSA